MATWLSANSIWLYFSLCGPKNFLGMRLQASSGVLTQQIQVGQVHWGISLVSRITLYLIKQKIWMGCIGQLYFELVAAHTN